MDIATLTAKGQVTVPKAVRDDEAPLDVAYLHGLEGTLSEWSSPADEQAFADL